MTYEIKVRTGKTFAEGEEVVATAKTFEEAKEKANAYCLDVVHEGWDSSYWYSDEDNDEPYKIHIEKV